VKYIFKIAYREKDGKERYRQEIHEGRSITTISLPHIGKGERIVQVSEAGYQ
jgi:hypothetical protein